MDEEENEMFSIVASRMSPERLEDSGEWIHSRKMTLKMQMAAQRPPQRDLTRRFKFRLRLIS